MTRTRYGKVAQNFLVSLAAAMIWLRDLTTAGPDMRESRLSRRDMLKASAVLATSVGFAEPLKAAAPEPTPLTPALIQAARKEGSLAFYTAMEIPLAEGLKKAFEAKYPGINVRLKRSGAERVFERIGKEEDIRIHEVDVVCSSDSGHFVRWRHEGLLAPFLPEDVARHMPPEQIGPDGMYATAFASLSPIAYNTNLVKPEDAPTSFADLLDPRWQGKIVKGNPDYSGTIFTATFALSRDLGWPYFEKLARQRIVQVQSSRDPATRVASGQSAVQADGARSELLLLQERRAPVEIVYASEGTPLIIAPSAVFNSAPSPNAARLFQSFLFSIEAQQGLVDYSGVCSLHALVKEKPGRTPLSTIKLMKNDPEAMEAQREDVKARYRSIFGAS
jgi:iron(III) transport system substrate-binding protein